MGGCGVWMCKHECAFKRLNMKNVVLFGFDHFVLCSVVFVVFWRCLCVCVYLFVCVFMCF